MQIKHSGRDISWLVVLFMSELASRGVPMWLGRLKTGHCLSEDVSLNPGLAPWVKDLALLKLWHRSQMWLGYDAGLTVV